MHFFSLNKTMKEKNKIIYKGNFVDLKHTNIPWFKNFKIPVVKSSNFNYFYLLLFIIVFFVLII